MLVRYDVSPEPLTMSAVGAATTVLFLALSAALLIWKHRFSRSSAASPLPPGPKRLPVLGSVLSMPTKRLGPALRDMSKQFGSDLIYFELLGQPLIVINSYQAAVDILEGRSANTSDRPRSVMAELTSYSSWEFAIQGYTQAWRQRRRAFHGFFQANAVPSYRPVHLRSCRRFLQRLLEEPKDYLRLARHIFTSTIMDIVYGVTVAETNDRLVTTAERASEIFSEVIVPGRYLVELLPCLNYLPAWFPGAKFKRDAAAWSKEVLAVRDIPYEASTDAAAKGNVHPSMLTNLLESAAATSGEVSAEEDGLIRDVTAITYLTGADTTFYTTRVFFLAMAQFPDAQKKAQAELDAVVGPDRLPDFSDRDSLPYVNAVVKEVFRWHSIVPLGIWHRAIEEDNYKGYRIPAGCILVPNAWAMSQDEDEFPEPERFMPERYLKDGKLNEDIRAPQRFQFGFGRRICPGRFFADEAVFATVASLLHVFNIEPPLDDSGRPVPVKPRIELDLFLSYPDPFECRITPRSPKAEALISSAGHVEAK
ncbi:O-methylsterigmatocystin oxidoreductase [Pilatotrama ljubarskyi]|nr:O-methylsterigmatocystin oxidoreductase [Pilatotrama ljubarskyi]